MAVAVVHCQPQGADADRLWVVEEGGIVALQYAQMARAAQQVGSYVLCEAAENKATSETYMVTQPVQGVEGHHSVLNDVVLPSRGGRAHRGTSRGGRSAT